MDQVYEESEIIINSGEVSSMDALCQQGDDDDDIVNGSSGGSKVQEVKSDCGTESEVEPGAGDDGVVYSEESNQTKIESHGDEPHPVKQSQTITTLPGHRSDLTDCVQVNETIAKQEVKGEGCLLRSNSHPTTASLDPVASTSGLVPSSSSASSSPSKGSSQVLVQSNVHYNPSGTSLVAGPSRSSSIHYNSPSHSTSTNAHHHCSGHHRPSHQLNFDEIIEEISSNTSSNSSHNQDVISHDIGHDSLYGHHYLNSYHPSDQGSVSASMNVHPPSNDVDLDTNIELISSTPLEIVQEPVIIRGNGNMTLFGLSNTFNNEFPPRLVGHVSKEEFEVTINKINNLLKSHHSTNAKILLLGCLCCCCSFGCSLLWPTIALSKRTRNSLEKLINIENHRMYHKLGLNWKIDKQRCHSNHAFMEYVLVIEFIPKLHLYQPD